MTMGDAINRVVLVAVCAINAWLFEFNGDGVHIALAVASGLLAIRPTG